MAFKSLGQVAYESYVTKSKGVSVSGEPLASWEGLSQEQKTQWEAGAVKVSDFYNDVKDKFRKNKGG